MRRCQKKSMKMPKYEDISPPESPLQKFPLLSPQEMRDVLADLEETDDNQSSPDNKEQFKGLLSDIPDLEGDCSNLSLGWNDVHEEENIKIEDTEVSVKVRKKENDENNFKRPLKRHQKIENKRKEKVKEASIPLQKGDLIEYLVNGKDEQIWFRVEVLSKGKVSGRNKNYINVRYSDGSVGGVFIEMHDWRKITDESIIREWRVNHDYFPLLEPIISLELKQEENGTNINEHHWGKDITIKNNFEKLDEERFENSVKSQYLKDVIDTHYDVIDTIDSECKGDSASLIKCGDIIDYLVEESGSDQITRFRVQVLSRGKSGGKNRNYLNVRYEDGSTGGIFIDMHKWKVIWRLKK